MMESRRYPSKLFTVVLTKDGLCNLNQPPFMNVGGSKVFLGRDASYSLLQSFPKSFGLKLWIVWLCFAS